MQCVWQWLQYSQLLITCYDSIIDVGNMVKNNNWDTDDVTKRQYSFGFFIANFGKISWIVMVLVTLTLNK